MVQWGLAKASARVRFPVDAFFVLALLSIFLVAIKHYKASQAYVEHMDVQQTRVEGFVPQVQQQQKVQHVKAPGLLFLFYAIIAIPALIYTIRLFRGNDSFVHIIAAFFLVGSLVLLANKKYVALCWVTLTQAPIVVTLLFSLSMWTTLPDVLFYIGGIFISLLYGILLVYLFKQLEARHDVMAATTVHTSLLAIGGIILLLMQQLSLLLRDKFAQLTVESGTLFGDVGLNVTIAFATAFVAFVIPAIRKHHNKNEIIALAIPIIIYIIGMFVVNDFAALIFPIA